MALTKIGATLGGSANVITVTQNSHGLTLGYPVKMTSGGYAHATADSAANAEVVGIIIATSTNTLTIALGGRITVDGCVPNVTAGTVLFLQVSAGLLAATEPSNAGEISKPMAVVTVANSEMIMVQQRGEVLSTGAAAIADGSITLAKMAVNSIDSDQYVDGSIDTVHIDDLQVTSAKMANDTITEGKLDVSNAPTNGYFLQAQSGEGGGLTWAEVDAATATAAGITELATTAEINTGDDTGRTLTPKALADSIFGERNIQMVVFDWGSDLSTGNGKFYFYVPATLNGFVVQSVHAAMITAPTGADVLINIQKQGVDDIFSTPIKIAADTLVSIDSGTGVWVIDANFSTLTTGTIVRVDVDQVGSSTAGKGLYINLTCRLP